MRLALLFLFLALGLTGCRSPGPDPVPVADHDWPVLGWDHPRLNPVTNWIREPVFPPLPARGDARPTARPTLAAASQQVTLAWLASPSPEVTGYRLYWRSATATNQLDVGAALTAGVSNLTVGVAYTFHATAYTADGVESERSNEVEHTPSAPPAPPGQLRIVVTPQQSNSLDGPWTPVALWPALTVTNDPASNVFYRYHIQRASGATPGEGGEGMP